MDFDRSRHSIQIGEGCAHARYEPPWGDIWHNGKDELRRCPNCRGWWRSDRKYSSLWNKIGPLHIFSQMLIRKFEREEAMSMRKIISSDENVED